MAKFASIEEMAKTIAENAMDNTEYKGKTIREWIEQISNEQRESEWLPSPDGINPIRCKKCNMPALFVFLEDEFGDTGFYRHPSNFCPNCGSKMKGADYERK